MIARIDGQVVAHDALWWPELNFDQFRWDGVIGGYELIIRRHEFVERLGPAYAACVNELKEDDAIVSKYDPCSFRDAGYPPLDQLPDDAAAFSRAVRVYLWDDLFRAFLPSTPTPVARFMVNSVDAAEADRETVVIRGRGYHGAPGFAHRHEDRP